MSAPGGRREAPPIATGARLAGTWRDRRLLGASGPMLLLAGAALLPAARPLPFPLCLWHLVTGLPCLTCGLTRSVCYLVQGDPAVSFALHPAGPCVVLLLALHALWRGCEAARGRLLAPRALAGLTAGIGAAAAMLAAGAWVSRLAGV